MPLAAREVPSPFKFLDAYTKNDGAIFFGRDAEIEQLYQSVNKNRIVLVYGQSGTGKTSLVQCGLSNRFEVTDWVPFWIRRGKNINESLYQAISQSRALGGAAVDQHNLFQSLERLSKRYVRPIYLLFDQFEELLLLGDDAEKRLFLETVQGILSRENTEACHLLFIIREEYFGWLESFESAIPGFSDRRLRVEPMRPDRLDEVILQSCSAFNISLQDPSGNTRQIRESLRTKGGVALPYLQVYLDMLYRQDYLRSYPDGWTGQGYPPLSFETREIKNMGAITDLMERLLDERREAIQLELSTRFPGLDADLVEDVLDNFVTFEGTKRPVPCMRTPAGIRLGEKAPAALRQLPLAQLSACLEALENNRLLRADEDTFELAHDSLAALIDRRRTDEQRRINEVYRQIRNSHQVYQSTKTDFLSRNQLALYENYLPYLDLEEDLRDFLAKSRQHLRSLEEADREKLIEERQLRESAEKNARRAKLRSRLAIGLSLLATAAAVWAVLLFVQTRRAKDEIAAQVVKSQAAELAAKSRKVFYSNHNAAWQLAARAYELLPTPETALALRDMSFAIRPAREMAGGHTQKVTTLQFSQDGRYRMSAATDNTVRIVSTGGSGSKLITLQNKLPSKVEFSADGRYLIAGLTDTVQVWDLEQQEIVWQKTYQDQLPEGSPLEYNPDAIDELAITADGGRIAIGHSREAVSIYDWNSDSLLRQFSLSSVITDLVFSPDGNFLAISAGNGPPALWGLKENRNLSFSSLTQAASVQKLAFSPDGKYLAGGDGFGNIHIWHIDGRLLRTMPGEGNSISALVFSPDSRQVLAGDDKGIVMRWYVKFDSRVSTSLVDSGQQLEAVAFSADGGRYFVADSQGNILSWPIDLETAFTAGDELSAITAVAYLDTARMVFGDLSGKLQLINGREKPELLYQAAAEIRCVALSPDHELIAAGTNLGDIYLIAVDGSTAVKHIKPGDSGIIHLEFSPDGRQLLTSNLQDNDVRLLTLDGKVLHTYAIKSNNDLEMAVFSPDGQKIFICLYGGDAVLQTLDGAILQEGFEHKSYRSEAARTINDGVSVALFTTDGRQIITGGNDGTIKIWDLNGKEIRRFSNENSAIGALALSPDGRYLATAAANQVVNIWTLDGRLIQSFNQFAQSSSMSFSPDGRYLLCASWNGIPELLPLWSTVLEKPALSLIDLHRYGGLTGARDMALFLAADQQTDLAAFARYFAGLYVQDGEPQYLEYTRQLLEKALSEEYRSRPDALGREWWLRNLQMPPEDDAPALEGLRKLYAEFRGGL